MSPRPLPTRHLPIYIHQSCRKASFKDLDTAQRALARILTRATRSKSRRRQVLPRRAYQCPDCGRWHLTSKPARRVPT